VRGAKQRQGGEEGCGAARALALGGAHQEATSPFPDRAFHVATK